MARLIDADELKTNCRITGEFMNNFECVSLTTLGEIIDKQPTIDPVKQGHWNLVSRKNIWDDLVDVYECSECKKYTTNGRGNTSPTDYCPNCGARMDGAIDED